MRVFGVGALYLALAFGIGAFGTHALKNVLNPDMLAVFQTGQQYHVYGALALMTVGLAKMRTRWQSPLILVGSLVFSGSLYCLALSHQKIWGAVTPIGGVLMIVGLVSVGIVHQKETQQVQHLRNEDAGLGS